MSRQTPASDESETSVGASPTLKRICHVRRWGKSDDGGGSNACLLRKARTFVRNGPLSETTPPAEWIEIEGNVKKSWKSAVTRLFIFFNGRACTTMTETPCAWGTDRQPLERTSMIFLLYEGKQKLAFGFDFSRKLPLREIWLQRSITRRRKETRLGFRDTWTRILCFFSTFF